jgi:hypothetical protein
MTIFRNFISNPLMDRVFPYQALVASFSFGHV